MKITVLGTGIVADTIGSKLLELGHSVMFGSRTATNDRSKKLAEKYKGNATVGMLADAAAFGEMIFNCTVGGGSLESLKAAGENNMKGKVLLDLAVPLDFSKGMPPSLFISNTSSLGEEIQKTFPSVKVVKALNTMSCTVMVNPGLINGGDHTVFICGNDAEAKEKVKGLLKSFDWSEKNILDLGDITSARGTEMYLPFWLRILQATNNAIFNIKLVS
jgi:8-hydroxy-5-deazaflavin:NADPH oxidoreductase